MRYGPVETRDALGRAVTLRSAEPADAERLLQYLRDTAAETPYLLRESDEVTMTPEQEAAFLRARLESSRELMLLALVDGQLAGSCSVQSFGSVRRYAHRCAVSIALYRAFWGGGVGTILLRGALDAARSVGYEQAELDVVAENRAAVALYEKLGFVRYGVMPRNMKYGDGSYADTVWMMKTL